VGVFLPIFSGHTILHPALAVEKLGSRQGVGSADGPQPWHYIGCGKKTEEKTSN